MLTLMQVMHGKGELTPEKAQFMAQDRPEEELYDIQNDPYELYNLTYNKSFLKEKKKLSEELDKWLLEADHGKISGENFGITVCRTAYERVF
jgi:uncharacterized sulfatase